MPFYKWRHAVKCQLKLAITAMVEKSADCLPGINCRAKYFTETRELKVN
jgi:hypothetical protein